MRLADVFQVLFTVILVLEVIFLERKNVIYKKDERGKFIHFSSTRISFFMVGIPFVGLLILDSFNLISQEWFGPAITFLVLFMYTTCTISFIILERRH